MLFPTSKTLFSVPNHLTSSHTSFGTQLSSHLLQEVLPDSHALLGDILVPSLLYFVSLCTVYILADPLLGSRSVEGKDCVSFVLYSIPTAHYCSGHLVTMKHY